jgi:PEP-CTERM motif
MIQKRLALCLGLVLGSMSLVAAPANAVTFTNPGDSASLSFNGLVDGDPLAGLSGTLDLMLESDAGNRKTFSFKFTNTSSALVSAARISAWGFNSTPDITGASIVGGTVFDNISNGPVPGLPRIEFCATTGPNCAGGGGDGVLLGQSATGAFELTFASAAKFVNLDQFFVRYQSIEAPGITGGSGVGTVVSGVPEPASWAMLICGFGLAGAALRRRRVAPAAA